MYRIAGWRAGLLACLGGAALPFAFSPYQWWWLAILMPALQLGLWLDCTPRIAAWRGFWFAAGQFGVGTYWLYISIHGFGQAPIWLALLLMLLLVAIMSLYQALLAYLTVRWRPRALAAYALLWAPALWMLLEWLRGWFLSGFSWLSLAYAQTDSPLAGYAPLGGMYFVSWLCVLLAGALLILLRATGWRWRAAALLAPLFVLGAGWPLSGVLWVEKAGDSVRVAIVQGAIPQDEKWLQGNQQATLDRYRELTESAHGVPLIVWPEAAAPDLVNNLGGYFGKLYDAAQAHGSAIVMGALRADDAEKNYYNSVLALDNGVTWYDKHHLVPFAEFFPVPPIVRSWLRLMNLPYSDFTRGAAVQKPLPAAGLLLAASVCYEDAYAATQLPALRTATALVNVTNDAWFGDSAARYQHLQMSRWRALEARRYLVRAANDGVSAVIDPFGRIVSRAPEFQPAVLRSSITPYRGVTPFAQVGNFMSIGLALLLILAGWLWRRRELSSQGVV
jgi:apolipoprotein N-acyltransferase